MILVTGGTGFVGKALIRQLAENDYPVRTLIRPSQDSPDLPAGIPVEVAVSSLTDERGLRGAMVGVDTVYNLASAEWRGARADLMQTDIQGSRAVVQAAIEAGVKRLFFVSHLGADRASAYPVLKAKAISEEHIRRSGIDYTILRTAILYGPDDGLTTGLARLLSAFPYFFFMPGDGQALLQPLWVEDLVTCLTWSLEEPDTINKMVEIGGPEYLTITQIIELVMEKIGIRRTAVNVNPPYMRVMTVILESLFPGLPVSVHWLDYLAANRTCALDTVPRLFGLLPSRMSHRLNYLEGLQWRQPLVRSFMRRRR